MRRTRSHLVGMLAGLAVATVLALVPTAPAAADGGATVGIAAAPATQGRPDGRSRFSLLVQPGQQVGDSLLVRNAGSTDQQLHVYATDAFDTSDGAFALLDRAAPVSGAGTWVAFEGGARETTLTLAAGAQTLVPFTVSAPAGATPGDHAGGIVVSVSSTTGSLTVDRRLATRLYVRVRGTVQPALTVRSVTATQPAGGSPLTAPTTVTAVVVNTGDVALSARADVGVGTWFGLRTGRTTSHDVLELLPGATRTLTFDVGPVARAGYLAPQVTLTPVADPEAYGFSLPPVVGAGTVVAVPWLLLGVALVAGVGGSLLVARRRARPEPEPAVGAVGQDEGAAPEPEPVDETPTSSAAAGGAA